MEFLCIESIDHSRIDGFVTNRILNTSQRMFVDIVLL